MGDDRVKNVLFLVRVPKSLNNFVLPLHQKNLGPPLLTDIALPSVRNGISSLR